VTFNLEENVSCKNLIWFDTKLLRTQTLVSDARRNVRLYTTINDGKSPLKGSRPSVPHGTNFLKSNIVKTARLKDKVTIAQEEMYLAYGRVLCLVTLIDWPLNASRGFVSISCACYYYYYYYHYRHHHHHQPWSSRTILQWYGVVH